MNTQEETYLISDSEHIKELIDILSPIHHIGEEQIKKH